MTTSPAIRQQILSNGIAECCYTVLALAIGPDSLADSGGVNKIPLTELRGLAITSLEELIVVLDECTQEALATAEADRLRSGQRSCAQLAESIARWDGVAPFPEEAERAFDAMFATFGVEPRSTLKDMIAATLNQAEGRPTRG